MASATDAQRSETAATQTHGQSLGDRAIPDHWHTTIERHPAYLARQSALLEIEALEKVSPFNWAIGIVFIIFTGAAAYLFPEHKWIIAVFLLVFLADAIARRVNKQILIAQNQQIVREWEMHRYLLSLAEKLDTIRPRDPPS